MKQNYILSLKELDTELVKLEKQLILKEIKKIDELISINISKDSIYRKEVEKTIGYYTSFKNALECVARHKFYEKKEDYSSIKSYINSWQEVKLGIETLLNEIKI